MGYRKVSFKEGARLLENLDQRILRKARAAEKKSIAFGLEIAKEHSQGRYSSAQLAQMGHPYQQPAMAFKKGKPRPIPPDDPSILNLQTGEFEAAWQATMGTANGFTMTSSIYNNTPYAKFFNEDEYPNGTMHMIARPIISAVAKELEPIRLNIFLNELQDLF